MSSLRGSLQQLQREQQSLRRRLQAYEQADAETAAASAVGLSESVVGGSASTPGSGGGDEAGNNNFYVVSVSAMMSACTVQCVVAFGVLMQLQVQFPTVHPLVVLSASMALGMLVVVALVALMCARTSSTHTVYVFAPAVLRSCLARPLLVL